MITYISLLTGWWFQPIWKKYVLNWIISPGRDENTPPKFNMEPENDGFQKESPFPGTSFQVPC